MVKNKGERIRVCYILCYKMPNYTRTAMLVTALQQLPDVELTVIKNHSSGVARYWQTFWQLAKYRLTHKPDVCILGFRGQEVFGLFYPFMRGSRIIFDEFLNMHDWFVNEHHKLREGSLPVKLLDAYIKWAVRRSTYVLADTPAHALLSTKMYDAPEGKVVAIPVGAEEAIFKPQPAKPKQKGAPFEVFFYGNMLPLHGLGVILDAIKELQGSGKLRGMHFTIIGGKGKPAMMRQLESFIKENNLGGHITHLPWAQYEKLPAYVAAADVCLGGPFGGTGQARRVITGKTFQFMAMGKATIIGETDNAGLFTDKRDCLIVHQNDPSALATALLWVQAHPKELAAIDKNARALYESKFSSAVIARALEKLLAA